MYLYSSHTNSLKIMLSKADAEQFILNQTSPAIRKCIISAIFKAALPKSKFSPSDGNISVKLIEYPQEVFILEFTQVKQQTPQVKKVLRCYVCANLNDVAKNLQQLTARNAEITKLYCKGDRYFLLSDKHTNSKIFTSSEYIDGILEEYANLISENAASELKGLL